MIYKFKSMIEICKRITLDEQKTQPQPPTPPITPTPPVAPTMPSPVIPPIPTPPIINPGGQLIPPITPTPQIPSTPTPPPPKTPIVPATPKITTPPPATPKTPIITQEKPISTTVDFTQKESEAEIIKYSIRTMAQDLERAQKEGMTAGVKLPSAPPPPPAPKVSPLKAIPTIQEPSPTIPAPTPPSPKPLAPSVSTPPIPTPTTITPPQPSIKPLPSIKPGTITPPAIKPSRLSFPHLNLALGIIAAVVLLSGTVGFSYWWFFVKEAPVTPIVEEPIQEEELPPPIAEPQLPKNIVSTDKDIIVEIDTQMPSPVLKSKIISQLSIKTSTLNTDELGRILIKYSSDKEKTYLPLNQSLVMLDLAIPQNVSGEISDGELLVYNQNGKMRYGFTAKISNGLRALDAMNSWEATMPDDTQPLFMDISATKPTNGTFRDNFYETFIKSYYNFTESDASIDWGVSDDKKILIVATSKNMIYKIIDSIPVIGQ